MRSTIIIDPSIYRMSCRGIKYVVEHLVESRDTGRSAKNTAFIYLYSRGRILGERGTNSDAVAMKPTATRGDVLISPPTLASDRDAIRKTVITCPMNEQLPITRFRYLRAMALLGRMLHGERRRRGNGNDLITMLFTNPCRSKDERVSERDP